MFIMLWSSSVNRLIAKSNDADGFGKEGWDGYGLGKEGCEI